MILTTYLDKKPFARFEVDENDFKSLIKTWGNKIPIENFMNFVKLNKVYYLGKDFDSTSVTHVKIIVMNLSKKDLTKLTHFCINKLTEK